MLPFDPENECCFCPGGGGVGVCVEGGLFTELTVSAEDHTAMQRGTRGPPNH